MTASPKARARAVRLLAVGLLSTSLTTTTAHAQEMCGDGTTFTVALPSVQPGGDGDSIQLPRGCRIYALFVSGYARNPQLDELTFFNVAKFVAENNGYVHWAWWNNLLKPYMEGPLHPGDTVTNPITHVVHQPSPGALPGVHALGFVPAVHEFGLVPKAVPEEDTQFQADAKILLRRIKEENPDAIVIVGGHSMGGNAVTRLGANTVADIDLLAPIDPVGNRSSPIGRPTVADLRPDRTFNWTRWRAKWEFAGFRVADCVRNAIFLCQNFGTLLHPEFRCTSVGSLLSAPPVFPGSLAPIFCPGPVRYSGKELKFGQRVKRLYHRWQNETLFPFDYATNEIYNFHGSYAHQTTFSADFANMQFPVVTCALGLDPRNPARLCNPTDGHGEIVGFRAPTPGQPNPPGPNLPVAPLALQALSWPLFPEDGNETLTHATMRRTAILQLAAADASWPHRPVEPNLDLVSGDMIAIVANLLASAPVPSLPTTTGTVTPGPNDHGWNNTDVEVNLVATAGLGHAITEIIYTLSGAQQSGPVVHRGDSVDIPITAEGDTTITFFARDDGAVSEEPQQLTVRIDKTPPSVLGTPNPAPNATGWNNTNVTVTFTAQDALSGIDAITAPVTLTQEGAGQEANGTATDLAGNTSATTVTVNIDKSAPTLVGLPEPGCVVWPLNQKLVAIASVTAADGLSGVQPGSLQVGTTSSERDAGRGGAHGGDVEIAGTTVLVRAERLGSGEGRTYTVTASVQDAAGNQTSASGSCFVPHDRGKK